MAARKGTISKFTLAFATACLLTITSAPVLSQNIEQLFQQGYDAGISGRFEEAESIFRQVIRIDPNNSTAYHNLGLALIQQSQLYLAIANYQKAIQLNPNLAEAYNGLGNAFIQLWHLNLASANYQKAIQLNPNLAEAYNGLGNALMQQWKLALQEAQLDRQQWQLDLAITNYQKAIQLNPNLTEALSNLSIAQRQKEKIRQSKQEKDNFNLILRQYNRSSITQKEFNEEIGSMKELQEIPIIVDLMSLLDNSSCVLSCFNDIYHDANIYNELGNALLKQGKVALAITSYKLAIELTPNHVIAYNNLGNALFKQEKFEEAINNYRQAIQIDTLFASAYNNLGVVLFKQGKLEAAISNYYKAIQINPYYLKAYNNLIGALFKQGKSEVALREYLNSLEIKTDDENNFNAKYYELREQERQFFIQRKLRLLEIDKPIFLTNQANKTSDNNRPSVDILRSTARIIAEVPSGDISIGAGWVVKKSSNTTWIVTNRHVISDSKTNIPSKKIKVEFFSELPYEERSHYAANIVKSTEADDYKLDLAVLKVTGIPNNVQSLEIFSGKFKHYANVQTIGHSFIRENSWIISQGEVQDYNINNLKFSINGIFSKGNSGAPVIDINDQIIGMMVGMRTNEDIAVATDQINFNINVNQPFTAGVGIAYRIDIVIEKLREWGIIE